MAFGYERAEETDFGGLLPYGWIVPGVGLAEFQQPIFRDLSLHEFMGSGLELSLIIGK